MGRAVKLTNDDHTRRMKYEHASANSLGNLHERMHAVVDAAAEADLWKDNQKLWNAICDLRTEVAYYVPAKPPYARRFAKASEFVQFRE